MKKQRTNYMLLSVKMVDVMEPIMNYNRLRRTEKNR